MEGRQGEGQQGQGEGVEGWQGGYRVRQAFRQAGRPSEQRILWRPKGAEADWRRDSHSVVVVPHRHTHHGKKNYV